MIVFFFGFQIYIFCDMFSEKTSEFLKVYKRVNKHYAKTRFTEVCTSKLSQFGVIVLIGEQGSGKTSTAVHIMNNPSYLNWSKHKITSFSDLLMLKFEEKSLIYLDNAFDGFLYHQELYKWWQSFCYFYFEILETRKNIRLVITTKPNEIEKACAFVDAEIRFIRKTCFVRVDSFPLSEVEKLNILENQIKLANELKNIDSFVVTEKMKDKLREKTCPIGFPLCAHLYCFETNTNIRDTSIFDNPRSYVRRKIKEEIDGDGSNGVKTLLLLLVYYFSSGTSSLSENLDLKYEADCDTLREKCPKVLLDKFEPLSFVNLSERAETLKDDVLIKHHTLYEFKHQVYLEEVSNYFFRANFDAVVDHFPLSILRTYEMDDFSQHKINKFIGRLKQEIEQGAISEALNCKLFQEPQFEEEFCKDLQKDRTFLDKILSVTDKTSGFKFSVIFWVSKYHMLRLERMILDFAKRRKDGLLPFYLALFGGCCAQDESFIMLAKFPLQKEDIQRLVLSFKTHGGTISDLILSSGMSLDENASHILDSILMKSKVEWKGSFLDYIINQFKPGL